MSTLVKRDVPRNIAKNSLFNLARSVLSIPIVLWLTPYIVKHLGKEEFGIWALVAVFASFAQTSDLGITESSIKFIAEYQAHNDHKSINQLINTAMVAYSVISLAFFLLFMVVLDIVIGFILNIPMSLHTKARFVFTVCAFVFFTNLTMSIFGSLFIGFQKMEFSSTISIISMLLTALGTFIFLSNDFGLYGLTYNYLIVTLITITLNLIFAKRVFPDMRIGISRHFSKEILSKLMRFGCKVQVTSLTQLLIFQIDRMLVSHYFGLAMLSNYEIANRLAFQARNLVASVFLPITPAASALDASQDHSTVTNLYVRSFKYMSMLVVPLSFLIVALAHPFVNTWMGPGYEISAWTLQLLMVTFMLNLLTGPGSFILSGINKPHLGMRSSLLAGITNPVISLILIYSIGYYGVPVGMFISIFLSGTYFMILVHHNIHGLDWRIYTHILRRPVVVSLSLCLVIFVLERFYSVHGFVTMTIMSIIYIIITSISFLWGSYLDRFDFEFLHDFVHFNLIRGRR